jgi:hypothetical protein
MNIYLYKMLYLSIRIEANKKYFLIYGDTRRKQQRIKVKNRTNKD